VSVPPTPAAVPLGTARSAAARLLGRLERNESALRLAVTGETRRMAPWVRRLDLLATAHEAAPLLDALAQAPRVAAVLTRAERSVEVQLDDGLRVRLEVLAEEAEFGPALVRATGPTAYVGLLEARAAALGLVWRGHTLWQGSERLVLWEEAEVYERLGLERPAPELRERALPGAEVADPVVMTDIRGAAGLHVKPGGGRYGLKEMAARAQREGYGWSLLVAPADEGTTVEQAQSALAGWNEDGETSAPGRLALEVLLGAASPDAGGAPLLLASAVSHDATATAELTRAARDPRYDAFWLRAPPAPPGLPERGPDLRPLLQALAATGAALAVSPPPHHPRPEPELLEAALALGVPLLLLADARDLVGVDDLVLSVGLARRAGARREQVLNTLDLAGFDAWLARRRARAGGGA